MMTNLNEFRLQKQSEINEMQAKVKKRRKRFLFTLFGFIGVLVMTFFVSMLIGNAALEDSYKEYMSLDEKEAAAFPVTYELLQYKDASDRYESLELGNSNGNLISYGQYCENSEIRAESSYNGLTVSYNGSTSKITNKSASYINVINDAVYYRKDDDFTVWKYSIKDKTSSKVIGGRIGQTLVSSNGIYYIDLRDSNHLYLKPFDSESINLVNESVKSFALLGDTLMYLSGNNVLKKKDMESKSITEIQNNVSGFIFSNSIIIENNGSLIEFTTTKPHSDKLYSGDARLLNADAVSIMFVEDGNLFSLDRETGSLKQYGEVTSIIKCVSITQSEIIVHGYYMNGNKQPIPVHKKITR